MANILLNLLLIVSLSITVANAKDYYVAQNGIDANDGSENKPWRSIQQAARTAQAGDTVFMNANYGALEFLDGATDFEIENNIFSIRGNKSFIVMDRSSKPGALIDANCFHNRASRARGLGTHSTVGDPRFVNPANNDFRLQKGSPCANAGAEPANIPQPHFLGKASNQRS